jgi:hypothetical protein
MGEVEILLPPPLPLLPFPPLAFVPLLALKRVVGVAGLLGSTTSGTRKAAVSGQPCTAFEGCSSAGFGLFGWFALPGGFFMVRSLYTRSRSLLRLWAGFRGKAIYGRLPSGTL